MEQALDPKVETDRRQLRDEVTQRILVQTGLVLRHARHRRALRVVGRPVDGSVACASCATARSASPSTACRRRWPGCATRRCRRQLSPVQVANQIAEPLPVRSKDEFGQVTEAFNAVHLEAVRTAAEQAALRSSVATMFVNLARRSQILVDRLIGHLDRLERGEEDPDRLAELFQLDHLATRMRRNDENLLVLAGADSTRVQREPAALLDVLRAAQSEVEHYTRIEFGIVDRDIEVAAHAVNDLVHLIAELFDNATAFSPPDSTVMVEARRVGDRAVLYVEDKGIGISPDMLARHQRASSPRRRMVDVAVSRMMGLVVVARLAARHGVKVELRSSAERGIIADVTLPTAVLVPRALAGRAGAPSREPSAHPAIESRPAAFGPPRSPFAAARTGKRLAWARRAGSTRSPADPAVVTSPGQPSSRCLRSRLRRSPRRRCLRRPVSGAGMPAWSDLTGRQRRRRRIDTASTATRCRGAQRLAGLGSDSDSFYGSADPASADRAAAGALPYRPVSRPRHRRRPDADLGRAGVGGAGVVPPPSIPPAAAPPVWPPVAEDRSQSPRRTARRGEFSTVRPGSPSGRRRSTLPYADETMELPIFRELESAWFSTRRTAMERCRDTPSHIMANQTLRSPHSSPLSTPTATAVGSGAPASIRGSGEFDGRDGDSSGRPGFDRSCRRRPRSPVPAAYRPTWQTAADEGWAAASAAAAAHGHGRTTTTSPGCPSARRWHSWCRVGSTRARPTPNAVRRRVSVVCFRPTTAVSSVAAPSTRTMTFSPGSTETGGQSGKEHEA